VYLTALCKRIHAMKNNANNYSRSDVYVAK